MRQSDFKMKYDPELGRCTRQHIYREGMMDMFNSFGSKLFGKTMKTAAKKGAEKAVTAAATKRLVIKILSKSDNSKKPKKVNFNENVKIIPNKKK